jgi:hypothetical protein
MKREELKLELKNLADRFSEGWHEGIKIDASDIMLLSEAAQVLAQRTWVGLTDEERLKLYRKFEDFLESDNWEYEKAIEAELKKKNSYAEEKNT